MIKLWRAVAFAGGPALVAILLLGQAGGSSPSEMGLAGGGTTRPLVNSAGILPASLDPNFSLPIQYVAGECSGGVSCSDSNDGSSWDRAKATIAAALNAIQALPGASGTIYISPPLAVPSTISVNAPSSAVVFECVSHRGNMKSNYLTFTGKGDMFQLGTSSSQAPLSGIRGCALKGLGPARGQTAISLNGFGQFAEHNSIEGFQTGIETDELNRGGFLIHIRDNFLEGNATNLLLGPFTAENIMSSGNIYAGVGAMTPNCVNASVAGIDFHSISDSFDACQFAKTAGTGGGSYTFVADHFETPNGPTTQEFITAQGNEVKIILIGCWFEESTGPAPGKREFVSLNSPQEWLTDVGSNWGAAERLPQLINAVSGDSVVSVNSRLGGGARFTNITSGGDPVAVTQDPAADAPQAELSGTTAGTAISSEPIQGPDYKVFLVRLDGYENTTATAQTISFPVAFTAVSGLTTVSGSCAGVKASLRAVTLPASRAVEQTGLCKIEGY